MKKQADFNAQASQFTSALIIEQWGETPIFAGPSWRISWPLPNKDYQQVASAIANGSLWKIGKACFPELPSVNRLDHNFNSALNDKDSPKDSAHLWAIKELAQALLDPSPIEVCHPKLNIAVSQECLVLKSVQHELLGNAIAMAAHLIKGTLMEINAALQADACHSLRQALVNLLQKIRICCAHPLTMAQLNEASRRKIPAFLLDPSQRLYQLGSGAHSRWISSTSNDRDSSFGASVAKDKLKSSEILRKLGLPVPREARLPNNVSEQQLFLAADTLPSPWVLKPQDAEQGRGVTANIKSKDELLAAACKAKKYTRNHLLLQEHIEGDDHRLNVVNGKLKFVVRRSAPTITGNGRDTVLELVNAANALRKRLREEDGISAIIDMNDKETLKRIASAGATLETILRPDQAIRIRDIANISTGGLREEIDVATVHPKIRKQCESIALSMRLDVCGIDYITPDITANPDRCRGAFIEINSMPQNSPKRAPAILDNLFPTNSSHSIKTTTIISQWSKGEEELIKKRLEDLINKHPSATVSFHRQLSPKLLPFLEGIPSEAIHIYNHPSEVMLNKASKSIIYLATPEMIINKGVASSHNNELLLWCREADLQPMRAWQAFINSFKAPHEESFP